VGVVNELDRTAKVDKRPNKRKGKGDATNGSDLILRKNAPALDSGTKRTFASSNPYSKKKKRENGKRGRSDPHPTRSPEARIREKRGTQILGGGEGGSEGENGKTMHPPDAPVLNNYQAPWRRGGSF